MADKFDWSNHYDIGVYGWWGHENFGGILTYFALNKVLTKMEYSVLMIQEAKGLPGRYIIPDDCIAMSFAHKQYNCSPQLDAKELYRLNDICDMFIIGGDQVWNYYIPFVKEDCFLNYVDEDKIKISYSSSVGQRNYNPPRDFVDRVKPLIQRLDGVSVREDYAVDIVNRLFNTKAVQVADAVFLLEKQDFIAASKDATYKFPEKFLFAFILNPTKEKRRQIEIIARKLGLDIVCAPDAAVAYHKSFNDIFSGLKVITPLSVENFIKAYEMASYIVTDSFHGTCMSYIFHKDFSVYFNELRGADRFVSLMSTLQLEERRISEGYSDQNIIENKNIGFNVDWSVADNNVAKLREYSFNWLRNILESRKKNSFSVPSKVNYFNDIIIGEALQKNRDFKNIQLLATLLRDYGVKHVVLSPGGRDVPIIRMFENNAQHFILHRVTDERSAAYYGLGIAAQLHHPVACVCTSGTAASNYLPAVTEAYYTGVPLILITADRYSVYLNHGEDQTIPQKNIYSDVVKMEVTLPESIGVKSDYQARRDIATCILETTHNGFGPVHINIPIENITVGVNADKSYWALRPFIYPHIQRVSFLDGETEMMRWVETLKKSNRILVVYGQNSRSNEKQRRNIEAFAKKYNCLIVTDHISNLDCAYTIQPYNMLLAMPQNEFDRELTPDIIISVGGKRLMNDPLTFKVRGGSGSIRHWLVAPDGRVKDVYFRLTSVIESSQDYFFEWFAEMAGDIQNNGVYYDKWLKMSEKFSYPPINRFNSHYVQSKFIPAVPANSILHLGVGQSFYDVRRYKLNSTVDVFCNMGTNGIDGCTSTFMGQCAVVDDRLCFLLVGDLSFFYDMNSIWNKPLKKNMRILMVNNNGTDLLRGHNLQAVSSVHNTIAEGWVRSTGFEYMSARSKEEYDDKLKYFLSDKSEKALFFEVFCE